MIDSINSIFSFSRQAVIASRMSTAISSILSRALQGWFRVDLIRLAREQNYLEIERLFEQEGQRRLKGLLRTQFEDRIRYLTEGSMGSLSEAERAFLIRQITRMEADGDRTRSGLKKQLQQL